MLAKAQNSSRKLKFTLSSVMVCLLNLTCLMNTWGASATSKQADREPPNIIWIVMEDISPDIAVYGEPLVHTPNIDRLAAQGTLYSNAFATSAVCSPSRSAFFTGMYQTSIGAHHHPSHRDDDFKLPSHIGLLSDYLKNEGYYTILMGPKQKTDFNFSVDGPVFDAVDGEFKSARGAYAHGALDEPILDKPAWKQYKKKGKGAPFFAQINYSEAHRSFQRDERRSINPSDVSIPPYYPDHDLVRRDWALYLETIQWLDTKIGRLFEELESEEALKNTVVFLFGDHGRAMARGKQWLYDGGIKVPLIVWRGDNAGKPYGGANVDDRLVSLIDLMPATLSLADIPIPEYIQGRNFLSEMGEREYVYAQRDRLDSTYDRVRAIRGKRFKYIVNYFPELPYTQFNAYKKLRYPVVAVMDDLYKNGGLSAHQSAWMGPNRPAEELYDVIADPHEMVNLAGDKRFQKVRDRMALRLNEWVERTNDGGQQLESPLKVAAWDKAERARYEEVMRSRGLDPSISASDYLVWWDEELRRQGK